jgi:GMP synthase (glutamine-hydrolysing)
MIVILDFGSQYTQLIARRVREAHVYCEIHPYNFAVEEIRRLHPQGVILSGGPASVYASEAPQVREELFELPVPFLGICYGMGIINQAMGGKVAQASDREFGLADLSIDDTRDLFAGFDAAETERVWMSHGDRMTAIPESWSAIAHTLNAPIAAFTDGKQRFYGLQFHPEVAHTDRGKEILDNFLFRICGCSSDWDMEHFATATIAKIQEQVGSARVLCGLSGGVDSSVAATLIHRAIGSNLVCVFVNNGLLRQGEAENVARVMGERFGGSFRYVDASQKFLAGLRGVVDPEEKRKRIGNLFIRVFEDETKKLGDFPFLAQGTLYPDVIESVSFAGPSALIKSHHNVGGLPAKMNFQLVEPLRELFKDEVRAFRILGEVTEERLEILRGADAIVVEEIRNAGLYEQIWQSFAVLLPIRTVGVMGDERTYDNVVAIRAVESRDGMTADWVALPPELLGRMSNRIINEVRGVNRVVYDISSKPPATIEWE